MRAILLLGLVPLSMTLSGCLVRAAADVATAPIKVASKAVDLATTSQSEADEARGREIRRREERLGQLEREYREESEDCANGDRRSCRKAREIREEISALLPTIPAEPDD